MNAIIIEGKPYDLEEAVRSPALGDLVDLKRQTQRGADPGISVGLIRTTLHELGALFIRLGPATTDDEFDEAVLEFFDSVEHLQAFIGIVFLCRRKAGEEVSFEEAATTSLANVGFQFEDDGDEEDEADDPKGQPTPEVEGDAAPAA